MAAQQGLAAVTVCSTAFSDLGRVQAKALGFSALPIAVVPHPFGIRTRSEIHEIAAQCADDIARLVCGPMPRSAPAVAKRLPPVRRAEMVEAPSDSDDFSRFCHSRKWGDGLPLVPPTAERVEHMLQHAGRAPDEAVATMAPAYGTATVENIAINAVLAGCYPEYLPLIIAAVEAMAVPRFNLQAIQATTHPVAVWLIVNGPVARHLKINSGGNCLGSGAWANATLGRALRLILQNVGGAQPGEMDRATHGQPGKYTFCCAENETENPWQPLVAERGFAPGCSTVTVVGAAGTWNMNSHAKDAADLLRVVADTMTFPASNDYIYGGEPWLVLSPEHAQILQRDGLSKIDVKHRLWELSKMPAHRLAAKDYQRAQHSRRSELGEIGDGSLLPISVTPDDIGIIVAGGPGTHSVYVPTFGNTRSVTREVAFSAGR